MPGDHPRQVSGFTLLETLVAMAIAAILAAIALPGYRQIVQRSNRIEAHLALMKLQYLQERHYADHRAYASELHADGRDDSLPMATITENGNYALSMLLDADGQAYVAIAQARQSGHQAADHLCQRFSLDTLGVRRSATADGAWRTEPGGGCWS